MGIVENDELVRESILGYRWSFKRAHARVLYHVVTDMSDDSYFTSQRENWEKSNVVPR